jgi:hypothetical protein
MILIICMCGVIEDTINYKLHQVAIGSGNSCPPAELVSTHRNLLTSSPIRYRRLKTVDVSQYTNLLTKLHAFDILSFPLVEHGIGQTLIRRCRTTPRGDGIIVLRPRGLA